MMKLTRAKVMEIQNVTAEIKYETISLMTSPAMGNATVARLHLWRE
jgi:hypothetical protein